jgi:hypothetical protein
MIEQSLVDAMVADLPVLDRAYAACLADVIIDQLVIPALQRDRAIPPRSRMNWELALAEPRQRAVEFLSARIQGHVDRDDVVRILSWRGC